MGKRDNFWDQVPQDEEGQILWPEAAEDRVALVRDVFGAKVIGALEAILDQQLEIVRGVPPTPGQDNYLAEAARRAVFAKMSDVQQAEVCRVVKSACFGTLYWILVKLEHFPCGDVDFTVEPFTPEGKTWPPVGIETMELHHLYFDWIERFSDHGSK
jgi:hypothetical protein